MFFRLVVRRYEWASMVVTSNNSFLDWGEVFGDPLPATAILDHLPHSSTTLNIKGERCRLKEKRRAGLWAEQALPYPTRRRWNPSLSHPQGTSLPIIKGHFNPLTGHISR